VISFRYHVVSIVAVFLALALGVVVGTTALNGPITKDLRNKVDSLNKQRAADLSSQAQLQQQVNTGNQFASTYAAQIVGESLVGDQVIMISMPNASSSIKEGVLKELAAAGATVSGRIQLTGSYTDPKRASDVISLVKQVQPIGLTLPVTQDAGTLSGALLSYVLSGEGEQSDVTQTLAAFSTAQMLKVEGSDKVTPTKMIVVVSSGTLPSNDPGGSTQLQLVTQLQLAGCHTVLAGDNASATSGGLIALVRGSDADKSAVSTIDNADSVVGQVSTVLALSAAATGKSGAYGTGSGAQSTFPSTSK
jgi:hypothetical protein